VLRDFEIGQAQLLTDEIARQSLEMRDGTPKKLKSILSAIFKRAIKLKHYAGANPIRDVELADAPEAQDTYAYNLAEIRRILTLVPDETTKVIIAWAGYTGVSKSEIQGLVWEAYNRAEICVLSSVVDGKRGKTKTKARKARITVIGPLRKMLDLYRLRMGNPQSGVMFPTKNGTPLSLHIVYYDRIKPAARSLRTVSKG
jgi:integrase